MTFSVPTLDSEGRFESPAVRAEIEAMAQAKAEEVVAATPGLTPEQEQALRNASYDGTGTGSVGNYAVSVRRKSGLLIVSAVFSESNPPDRIIDPVLDIGNAPAFLAAEGSIAMGVSVTFQYNAGSGLKTAPAPGFQMGMVGTQLAIYGEFPAEVPQTGVTTVLMRVEGILFPLNDVPPGQATSVNLTTGAPA